MWSLENDRKSGGGVMVTGWLAEITQTIKTLLYISYPTMSIAGGYSFLPLLDH
jgi:hypothetical protein